MCAILSGILLLATPWTVAQQAPLSMGFPRQEYWSALPFPSPGELPDPGTEAVSLPSPALSGGFFPTVPPGDPLGQLAGQLMSGRRFPATPVTVECPVFAEVSVWRLRHAVRIQQAGWQLCLCLHVLLALSQRSAKNESLEPSSAFPELRHRPMHVYGLLESLEFFSPLELLKPI